MLDDLKVDNMEQRVVDEVSLETGLNSWYARTLLRVYKWDDKKLLKEWKKGTDMFL